jgi:hypothetical protein
MSRLHSKRASIPTLSAPNTSHKFYCLSKSIGFLVKGIKYETQVADTSSEEMVII